MKKLIDVKEFLKKTLKPSLDIPPPHLSCYGKRKKKEYTTIAGQEICRNAAMKRKMVVALSNPQWEQFLFEVTANLSGVVFIHAHFQKIAQISSL